MSPSGVAARCRSTVTGDRDGFRDDEQAGIGGGNRVPAARCTSSFLTSADSPLSRT